MTGEHLYKHWWDCVFCETGEEEAHWTDLEPQQQLGWNRLAQCVNEGRGVSFRWLP